VFTAIDQTAVLIGKVWKVNNFRQTYLQVELDDT